MNFVIKAFKTVKPLQHVMKNVWSLINTIPAGLKMKLLKNRPAISSVFFCLRSAKTIMTPTVITCLALPQLQLDLQERELRI
jgi:hypothetical protein